MPKTPLLQALGVLLAAGALVLAPGTWVSATPDTQATLGVCLEGQPNVPEVGSGRLPRSDAEPTPHFIHPEGGGDSPLPVSQREVIGYFTQWGIYQRHYLVKDIVASGAADTLTLINYAFAGIGDGPDGKPVCVSLDPYADWKKGFSASESLDGVADTGSQPLKGNFNQLRKLKLNYPKLRVLISIGGWSGSERFSEAAQPGNRVGFVSSCVDRFIKGHLADGISAPGLFDGIDIDWEHPAACGARCTDQPEDATHFTALMAELRRQLDRVVPHRQLLLTAALPAAPEHYNRLDLPGIAASVDWLNLMTYDFHGSWEPHGPTNHQANLHPNAADPSNPRSSLDATVRAYLAKGAPANKIAIGLPCYGRGWGGVPAGGNHGLYETAGRIAPGTREQGVEDYQVLKTKGYPEYWDATAEASWLYNGSELWTFDSPRAVRAKMDYLVRRGLKGVMLWELGGDDGTLVRTIADGLKARGPCGDP